MSSNERFATCLQLLITSFQDKRRFREQIENSTTSSFSLCAFTWNQPRFWKTYTHIELEDMYEFQSILTLSARHRFQLANHSSLTTCLCQRFLTGFSRSLFYDSFQSSSWNSYILHGVFVVRLCLKKITSTK